MTTILDLNDDVMHRVLANVADKSLFSVQLTCRAWLNYARLALAEREDLQKWYYKWGVRRVKIWQKLSVSAFVRLSHDGDLCGLLWRGGSYLQSDLNAVDVPGTVAHFARAVFNLNNTGPGANREFRTDRACGPARFQIRDAEAMDAFLHILEHDMLQLMEKAVLHKVLATAGAEANLHSVTVQARDLRGATCANVNASPQPLSAFVGNLEWDDWSEPLPRITVPDVGVSLDAQLRIVAAMARKAGIPKFDGEFTKLAWCILVNRAEQLIQFASMIATSGLEPDGHAPQFDDDELSDSGGPSDEESFYSDADDNDYEPEGSDESGSDASDDEDGEDDAHDDAAMPTGKRRYEKGGRDAVDYVKERAAKRRRTCRFDPVLHDGENIPAEWHFKTHHYVISPSAQCFRWAYGHM